MQDLLQFDFDGPFQRGREALFQLLKNPGDIAHEKEKAGRREIIYHTGLRRLLYESGLQKVQANNGWNFVLFVNGDLRISTRDETHIYHFAEQNILQYTLPDGKKYNRFADGQREVQFSDGHVQILFSNGIKKEIFTNKAEEITFPDGTRQVKLPTQAGTACTASAS
ncbi:T-complex 10 carboxy-terminus protein [Toxoplasma gondii MAS]|nr:T-complex 10 carboxy-terminus protein [Toxoplasma gondii MAS]